MWRSPVSVHGWGPCGRRFKSCHPDHKGFKAKQKPLKYMKTNEIHFCWFFLYRFEIIFKDDLFDDLF